MSEKNKSLDEGIKKLIETRTKDKVGFDTDNCFLWKLDHPKCFGCSFEVGCRKVLKIKLALFIAGMYEPQSFDDFRKMNQQINEHIRCILQARTVEELEKIPDL